MGVSFLAKSSPTLPCLGGAVQTYAWKWKGKTIQIAYEVLGEGTPILLLPAFSSVSSRGEMRGLAEALSAEYQVFVLDWPGFGDSDRPAVRYQPALYQAFLRDFVRDQFSTPIVVIAAGHAAGPVMKLAQQKPSPWSWVVLAAPTWRGPLPMMMGEQRAVYRFLQLLINLPLLGQFLYLLNTFPAFLYLMYRRHVYGDGKKVTAKLILQKWKVTQRWGARFASAAFVTGALDPVHQRDDFLALFQPLPTPTLIVIGEQTPPKSRREMEFLAHFSGVQVCRIPGSLGLHEENPDSLVAEIMPFMKKYLS